MKIEDIFAEQLYSFAYQDEDSGDYQENEFDRLMDLWTDVSFLREFAKENDVKDLDKFVNDRLRDAENIQDYLDEIVETGQPLGRYFMPLSNREAGFMQLSRQKGKVSPRDGLRLYAIKVDENCFVITGGAIKMSQKMQEHPETNRELIKLNHAQAFLKDNGVVDDDSFYELKIELE